MDLSCSRLVSLGLTWSRLASDEYKDNTNRLFRLTQAGMSGHDFTGCKKQGNHPQYINQYEP